MKITEENLRDLIREEVSVQLCAISEQQNNGVLDQEMREAINFALIANKSQFASARSWYEKIPHSDKNKKDVAKTLEEIESAISEFGLGFNPRNSKHDFLDYCDNYAIPELKKAEHEFNTSEFYLRSPFNKDHYGRNSPAQEISNCIMKMIGNLNRVKLQLDGDSRGWGIYLR